MRKKQDLMAPKFEEGNVELSCPRIKLCIVSYLKDIIVEKKTQFPRFHSYYKVTHLYTK